MIFFFLIFLRLKKLWKFFQKQAFYFLDERKNREPWKMRKNWIKVGRIYKSYTHPQEKNALTHNSAFRVKTCCVTTGRYHLCFWWNFTKQINKDKDIFKFAFIFHVFLAILKIWETSTQKNFNFQHYRRFKMWWILKFIGQTAKLKCHKT